MMLLMTAFTLSQHKSDANAMCYLWRRKLYKNTSITPTAIDGDLLAVAKGIIKLLLFCSRICTHRMRIMSPCIGSTFFISCELFSSCSQQPQSQMMRIWKCKLVKLARCIKYILIIINRTWSSESTVSGIMSGFFSSLSLPSSSLLPMLLSLGPGEPSPVVVPCDNSFRLKRFRRLPPHGNLSATIIANAPITIAADSPITTDSIGVSVIGARGRSAK